MPTPRIDLHTHSNLSDGTQTPTELMRAASVAGITTIGLTDHDTTAGWAEAAQAAAQLGIQLLPGIEISTRQGPASVHMLGYGIDADNTEIIELNSQATQWRNSRAKMIVARLAQDYPITWDEVAAQALGPVGRPHIADVLVAKGIIADRSAAFTGLLRPGSKYFVNQPSPTPKTAIEVIKAAGGVPIMAHPAGRGLPLPEYIMEDLVESGLSGLEIWHRDNSEQGKHELLELASAYDLIVTGSSDYHGAGKPNRLGEHWTEPEMLERILAAITS